MTYYGDFPTSHTSVCMMFDSFAGTTGAPSATSNFAAGDIQIYKDGGTTQRSSSAGIVVSTSFDGSTGLQMVTIDLSDNTDAGFYAAAHEYSVAVADVTIDSQTMRFWLGAFSIERAGGVLALIKAGTAKVTLADGVAHGGTLGSSTATLALSRQSIVSQSSNTAAVTWTGNGTGAGFAIAAGAGANANGITIAGGGTSGNGIAITTTSGSGITVNPTAGHGIVLQADGAGKHGLLSVGGTSGTCDGIKATAGTGGVDIRGNITGNITGTLATVTTLTNLPAITANWLTAAGTASDFDTEIAAAVWDLATSGHTTSGTFGAAMAAAGSAGDPWTTALPGAYSSGTAGFILGTNLDATVSSVKAKTDLIPGTQDGYTFAQMQKLFAAVLLGKASGLDTTTAVYRSANDSADRVTATVTADGNRTAVTLNP